MDDRPVDEFMEQSSISPAQTLSSDDNDSPRVIAWTAGRTMNRCHVLVCLGPAWPQSSPPSVLARAL